MRKKPDYTDCELTAAFRRLARKYGFGAASAREHRVARRVLKRIEQRTYE